MGRLEATDSNCLRRIVGGRLTDRHMLETRLDGAHVVNGRGAFVAAAFRLLSSNQSAEEDGHVEQLKFRPGHRSIKDFSGTNSSATWGCHEEGSGCGTALWDFHKLSGRTKLIPWPEIQAAAAERALHRQAWRDPKPYQKPCSLGMKKPQEVVHTTRSTARQSGSS
eukprot:365234-Chlamydomonas_euryale.AAC.1